MNVATELKQQATTGAPGSRMVVRPDNELLLVSACMGDMDGFHFSHAKHLPATAFKDANLRSVWRALGQGLIFAKDEAAFAKATGLSETRLLRIETAAGLGAGFSEYLRIFEQSWRASEIQRIAGDMVKSDGADPEPFIKQMEALRAQRLTGSQPKAIDDFRLPPDDDPSVLLGNRYLNRGDGMVLVSTSGMGKSSMDVQMAVRFALGLDFMGVKSNGKLKSLIIQSEDSDGDVAEIWESIRYKMALTDEQVAEAHRMVLIQTERVNRGQAFIDQLRRLVAKHQPDLVHINPLQAFIMGDVTEARDLGDFLRGGLNSLNEPATFGYIIVHHTVKPPRGRDKVILAWQEVMYDMAGGAEIINWARAIMSLRAAKEPGEFNLVLAKRGIRAGVTRQVEQGAGFREEIVTTIPLKHSTDLIDIPGRAKKLRCIYWEARTPTADDSSQVEPKGSESSKKYRFEDFLRIFPATRQSALGFRSLHRACVNMSTISIGTFHRLVKAAAKDGHIQEDASDPKTPKYWLKT